MKKLTKSVIKDIVKECLVEILRDGINEGNNSSQGTLSETVFKTVKAEKPKPGGKKSRKSQSYLDKINFDQKTKQKMDVIDKTARSVTDDPILGDMLADTAKTTLQVQAMAEGKRSYAPTGSGDEAQRIVESASPEELFGEESAGKWAHLAFGG